MSQPTRIGRFTGAFARLGFRHPWRVLLGAVVVTVAGAWIGSNMDIDPDLKALLPDDYPSVTRLEELQRRIGTQSDFVVEISSPDRAANIRFGKVLAARMEKLEELRYVIFFRDLSFFKDNALLYLPLPDLLKLRRKVMDRIKKEVRTKTVVQLDEDDDEGEDEGEEVFELDEQKWINKYFSGAETPGEYMEVNQGTLIVIKARPTRQTTDVEFTIRLVKKVKELIAELKPETYHAKMKAVTRAEYSNRAEATRGLKSDVLSTVAFAVVLLMVIIGSYFRTVRAVPVVLLPVVVATVATLGLGTAIFGTFNLVATFIFAILLGLGIDFGIHCLSRYQFERRRGHDAEAALGISLSSTGVALTFGALTTVAVFFLLQLGRFRGFSQFGALAGLGVLLALAATFFLVPALVTVAERVRPWRPKKSTEETEGTEGLNTEPTEPTEEEKEGLNTEPTEPTEEEKGEGNRTGFWRPVSWVIVGASFFVGAYSLAHALEIQFEYDFTKLDAPDPPPPPAPKTPPKKKEPPKKDFEDALGRVTTFAPAVATCDTAQQCEQVTRMLGLIRKVDDQEMYRLRQLASGKPVQRRPAPKPAVDDEDDEDDEDDWDEDDGEPRTAASRLRQQQKKLDAELTALEQKLQGGRLLPEEQKLLLPLGLERLEEMRYFLQAYLGLHMFIPQHQPLKLRIIKDIKQRIDRKRASLTEETGEKVDRWYRYLRVERTIEQGRLPRWVIQQMAQVNGKVGHFVVMWNRGAKADYADSLRLYKVFFDLPVTGGAVPVAANYFVLVEVIDTLREDGPVVLGAAALAVFFCLLISFRSLRSAVLVMVPLLVSISWLAGVHLLLDWKLNMFSVVAFPLLVGIGIDNGIHVYHRWQETRSVRLVMREVGGPIALTATTTFIGFAGLLLANHVGIQTLGATAATGIALALVGSVVVLPALLYCVDRGK